MLNNSALIENKTAIKCLLCKDIVLSFHRHDFKSCSCEACAIDGGNDYIKVTGEPNNYILLVGDFVIEIGTGKVLTYILREDIKKGEV